MRTLFITTVLVLSFGFLSNIAHAQNHNNFKELQNLQALAKEATEKQVPIMLMFGAQWCEYCELLNERVFEPMALGGLYKDIVVMRHVGVDEDKPIPGFNGDLIKKAQYAYQLDADLTPTVVFLNSQGQQVAPMIVGIQEITMFTNVIHRNLNIAYKTMGLNKQIPVTVELLEQQHLKQQNSTTK